MQAHVLSRENAGNTSEGPNKTMSSPRPDSIAGSRKAFPDWLAAAVREKATPVLVGLDPRYESLPEPLRRQDAVNDWARRAAAYATFCRGVIDVVAPLVAAVKPQAAFFEELGPAGSAALAEVIRYAREHGLLVIVDGKRNDIGSTGSAYAQGYLGAASAWGGDALTVNPYMGGDSLQPFLDAARAHSAGIFVLVKTSNPGGAQFQDLIADGEPIYRHVARYVARLAAEDVGDHGFGTAGAVVGATYPEQLAELRGLMPNSWLLVPGYGSQGGTSRDVAAGFRGDGLGALVNNSRGIIFAHDRREFRDRFGDARWQEAVEAATLEMIGELRTETSAGRLA
jgi:orotidine-5'-phosphate decarboxylase